MTSAGAAEFSKRKECKGTAMDKRRDEGILT
jgi:hypothetical protein